MYLSERARLRLAFATLAALALVTWGLTPLIGFAAVAVLAVLMGVGALPAVMLHWVRPVEGGLPTVAAAAVLALPGLGLSLQLWHDTLIVRGIAPVASLPLVAALLVGMQAVALRADRQTTTARG